MRGKRDGHDRGRAGRADRLDDDIRMPLRHVLQRIKTHHKVECLLRAVRIPQIVNLDQVLGYHRVLQRHRTRIHSVRIDTRVKKRFHMVAGPTPDMQ